MTNTQRTLALFRDMGYDVAIVERFIQYAGKYGQRKDMFGFGDIIGMNGTEIVAIQSCGEAFVEHHRKLTELPVSPLVNTWLSSGGKLFLVGWRKVKQKRGGKRMIYKPRIREYMLSDDENIMFTWKDWEELP